MKKSNPKNNRFMLTVLAVHVVVIGLFAVQGCQSAWNAPATSSGTPMPEPKMEPATVPAPVPVVHPPAKAWPSDTTTYVVASGDSLSVIAKRFNVTQSEVMALNKITDPKKLRVGQRLLLPGKVDVNAAKPVRKTAEKKAVAVAKPVTSAAAPVVAGGNVYVVKSGDCLSKIAATHGVKTAELRKANNLKSDVVRVGQKLTMPGAAAKTTPVASAVEVAAPASPVSSPLLIVDSVVAPSAPAVPDTAEVDAAMTIPPASAVREHKVEAGDDLYTIALMYGAQVEELKALNGIDEKAPLTAGQIIKIPAK
jgi:LysM repeat protein